MTPFTTIIAVAAPLPLADVDTDQILPPRFLLRTEQAGLGRGLFHDWRCDADGAATDFVLNKPEYEGAQILIAGANFGCGDVREQAVWALDDFGIGCVIAPSFAPNFVTACCNNGVLPLTLEGEEVGRLASEARGGACRFIVDLVAQSVLSPSSTRLRFDIDPAIKAKLLEGRDDITATRRREREIAAFEEKRRIGAPWLK